MQVWEYQDKMVATMEAVQNAIQHQNELLTELTDLLKESKKLNTELKKKAGETKA